MGHSRRMILCSTGSVRGVRELCVDFEDPALAERSSSLVNRIEENQSFLSRLRKKGHGKLCPEKVVDMVENARRRIEDQGRYDDGVARLYRSVEMWRRAFSTMSTTFSGQSLPCPFFLSLLRKD